VVDKVALGQVLLRVLCF